eukprot:403348913
MESSRQYFCHTCKKEFLKILNSTTSADDDESPCPTCGEYFLELIEDQQQLQSLKDLYKNEIQAQQQQTSATNSNANSNGTQEQQVEQNKAQRSGSHHSDDEFYDCLDEEQKATSNLRSSPQQVNGTPQEQKEETKQENASNHNSTNAQFSNHSSNNANPNPLPHVQATFTAPVTQTFTTHNGTATVTTQVNSFNINQFGQNQDWSNNLQNQINDILRNQGTQQVINQNGQNVNVQTAHGSAGDSQIHITNIETNQDFNFNIDGLPEDDGNEEWEDLEDDTQAQVQQINIDLNLENLDANDDQIQQLILDQLQQQIPLFGQNTGARPQPQQQQQHQFQQQQQNQQFQGFGGANNIFGNIFGGQGFGGPQMNQGPQSQTFTFNLNQPNGVGGLDILGGLGNLLGGLGGGNIEQNLLNQALQESLNQAMNQQQGIPTSKAFIQKLQVLHGTDLMQKKECQVCFEQFKDEDKFYKLPCKHLFHVDCILPWLDKHNTCPSCRHELPTDDLNYENRRRSSGNDPVTDFVRGNINPNNNNGGSGNGSANGSSETQNPSSFNSFYHS